MTEDVVLVLPGCFRDTIRGKVPEPDSFLYYLEPYNCSRRPLSCISTRQTHHQRARTWAGSSLSLLSFLIAVPADPQPRPTPDTSLLTHRWERQLGNKITWASPSASLIGTHNLLDLPAGCDSPSLHLPAGCDSLSLHRVGY